MLDGSRTPRKVGGNKALRRGLATMLLLVATGCTFASGDPTVFITSTPAGASIEIDGTDTGETTPAHFDLGTWLNLSGALAGDHAVTIRKNGYEPETRVLHHHTTFYTSKWIDGATNGVMFNNPIFWTVGDFFTPFGVRWAFVPHTLHVRLYPEGEAPGWDPGATKTDRPGGSPQRP